LALRFPEIPPLRGGITFLEIKMNRIICALIISLVSVAQAQTSSPSPQSSPAIITWKNGVVTVAELEADLLKMPQEEREATKKNPRLLLQILDNIQVYKELTAQAEKQRFVSDPVRISSQLAATRNTGTMFLNSESEKNVRSNDELTRAAKEHYLVNKTKYNRPERMNVAHILLRIPPGDTSVETKIKSIHQRALAGEDFAKLAMEFSDDRASKEKGGVIGFFAKGNTLKPFEDATFALKAVGEITPPFKTQYGWHVAKLIERLPSGVPAFEEIEQEVVNELKQTAINRAKEVILSTIRNDSTLKVDEKVFETYTGSKPITLTEPRK
jgi:peptidyl-prolyl cis-trans isomerase C